MSGNAILDSALILGGVALFTALSALVFQARRLKAFYGLG